MVINSSIAAISTINTNIATQAANEAKYTACNIIISQFDSKNCTIAQSQNYAECINFLYKRSIDLTLIIILKALFVLFLIGICIGIYKEYGEGIESICLSSLIYSLFIPLAACFIGGTVYGVYWLFI